MVLKKKLITALMIGLTAVIISFIGIALYNANKNSVSPVNSNISEFVGDSISVKFKYKKDGDYLTIEKTISNFDSDTINLTADDLNDIMHNALNEEYKTNTGWSLSSLTTKEQRQDFYDLGNNLKLGLDISDQKFEIVDGEISTSSSMLSADNTNSNKFSFIIPTAITTFHAISTVEDLIDMRDFVNGSFEDDGNIGTGADQNLQNEYRLVNDIDLEGTHWTYGIGTVSNPFRGTFDGQGYSIKNIFINDKSTFGDAIGLFGVINGATIKNLNLNTFKIYLYQGPDTEGSITDNVGILCGTIVGDSTIENIAATANESATSNWTGEVESGKDDANCGILVKDLYVKESGWGFWITYSASSQAVGGLIGSIAPDVYCTIKNVIFRGNISLQVSTAAHTAIAGGIVGIVKRVNSIDMKLNSSASTSDYYVIGSSEQLGNGGKLTNCVYEGEIYITTVKVKEDTSHEEVGFNASTTDNIINASFIGGICGIMYRPTEFEKCIGNVTAYSNPGHQYSLNGTYYENEPEKYNVWETSRICPGLVCVYRPSSTLDGNALVGFHDGKSITINLPNSGLTRIYSPISRSLLSGCASSDIKDEDYPILTSYDECKTYLDITQEGNQFYNDYNNGSEWFIDDQVNDGYPIPMTLLRIKDYKFTLTVDGGDISGYQVGEGDINYPTISGTKITYSSTIKASAVYSINVADNVHNLIIGADSTNYNFYYLGANCYIVVDDLNYFKVGEIYVEENAYNAKGEINLTITRTNILYVFPKSGTYEINPNIKVGWELDLVSSDYVIKDNGDSYSTNLPLGFAIEYRDDGIKGRGADNKTLFEFSLTITRVNSITSGYFDNYVYASSWLSTCASLSSIIGKTEYEFGRHYVGEVTTNESQFETITPNFLAKTYKVPLIQLNSTGGKVIPSNLIGEISDIPNIDVYFNAIVTISDNSVIIKYEDEDTNLMVIEITANSVLFNTDVAYWKYNDENNTLKDFPSEGLNIYEVSAIQAYLEPRNYKISMNYMLEDTDSEPKSYSEVKSYTYNISNGQINFGEPESTPKDKDGMWLLLDSDQSNPYMLNGIKYITSLNEADKVVVLQGIENNNIVGQWLFKYSTIFNRSIEGKTYYSINALITIDANDNYSYGELPSTDDTNPLIRSYWGNTYDVEILNEAINTLWQNNELNLSPSSSFTYAGVNSQLYTEGLKGTNKISIKISASADSQYAFASSETNDGKGISMFKFSDFTSENDVPKIEGSDNYYYVYAYGYKIKGWKISFSYRNKTYYLVIGANLDNKQNTSGVDTSDTKNDDSKGNADWECIDSKESNNINTVNSIESLLNENSNDLAYYADDLDQVLIGIIADDIKITMTPEWEAVTIVPYAEENNQIYTESLIYNDKGAQAGKEGYDLTDLIGKLFNPGQTISYFTTVQDGSYIANAGTWNYYNLSHTNFDYDKNLKVYNIALNKHCSDNIYRVNLSGIDGFTLDIEQTNYKSNSGETVPEKKIYTYVDFGYEGFLDSGYTYIEDYLVDLIDYISNYELNIGVNQDFYAYTIYNDGQATYIYLTNNRSIGYLPVYTNGSKILITWNNSRGNLEEKTYSYLTAAYDSTIHGDIENPDTTIEPNGTWEYSQSYFTGIDTVTFIPYFFRKTFNFDWHILFNGKESDVGYVILNVEDIESTNDNAIEDVSATYLLVNFVENDQTYHNAYKISDINGFNLSTFSINSYNFQNLNKYLVEDFYLYAGCNYNFYIYDQSKDKTAVSNNYLYKMLGYRLDSISSTSFGNFNDSGESRYSYSITADKIESMDFRNGEVLDFSAIFTKIVYSTSVNLDNERAGYLTIYLPDGSMMTRVNSSGSINFVLDDQIRVVYTAYIGYEFETNAVTLTYKDASNNYTTITLLLDSDIENQEYTFIFNALWLNTNYYSKHNTNYAVPNTATDIENIGDINVKTKQIEFEAKVKLYDGTKEFAVIDLVDEEFRWELDDETLTLSQLFKTTGSVGTKNIYGLIYLDNKYAVLSSWAYLPKRPTDNRNYYTTYNFPNYEIPTREYSITSDLLSSMVVTGSGEIVPKENRIIYFALEVYEQYEITMQAKALDYDTNSTTRTTTASCATYMYTSTLTLNGGAPSDAINKLFESTSKFYAYDGATFALVSNFDNNRYSAVSYEYNGMDVVGGILINSENINEDKTGKILISYIPRTLEARVEYYMEDNGSVVRLDASEVSNILETTLSSTGSLYLDSEVTININPVDQREYIKYNISVTVGDVIKEIVPNNYEGSDGLFTGKHKVSDNIDYNAGDVIFNVTLKMKSHDSVEVMFTLTDEEYWTKASSTLTNTRGLADDIYGNLKLFVDGEEIDGLSSNILEGQLVEVEVSLNFGYTLRGYRQNIGTIVSLPSTTTRFTITDSFNANENIGDGGNYTIYVSKDLYSAELRIDENSSKNYQIESAGSIKTQNTDKSIISLNNIYIGKTIVFNQVEDLANERLNYYYYINKEGEQVALELDNNVLKIDETILNDIDGKTLQFGVVTIKRYKLEYVVSVGNEFLGEISTSLPVEVNNEIQYYDVGTVINLKIDTVEPGKYVISLFGSIVSSGYTIDTDIELNSDKSLNIQIRADSYSVEIDEYIYSNIGDLSGGAVLPDTTVNAMQSSTQYYKENASISIAINSSDRILTGFVFTSGEVAFELSIKDNEITSVSENATYLDGVLTVTINEQEYIYNISILNGRLSIGYTSIDDISIEAYYTELKEISPN